MYIITFYSFKGGVGRTMALVNTAAELARRGRKVLVVDFDLEAPGLNTYKLLRSEKPHPGIVEFVSEFRATRRAPLVTDFLYEAQRVGKKDGRLWVMPAGRGDVEYRRMLNNLSWRKLYQDEEGFLLFEDTRLQWEAELHPDYVLIDARHGYTDFEGICTRQLADAVVVVFHPNEQNLVGLREVCRHIRAEKTSGLKKEITLHFVASNVPILDDEDGILQDRLELFRKELGAGKLDAVIHRYESMLLLNQGVFVLSKPRSRLAKEYRKLVKTLIKENDADRDGALAFLRYYSSLYLPDSIQKMKLNELDLWWEASLSDSRINNIEGLFWDDADILVKVAECRMLEGDSYSALPLFNRAILLNADLAPALLQRALCKDRLGDIAGAVADILQYLQTKDLLPHDVLRALRELAAISPDNLSKAIRLPSVQALDLKHKIAVGKIIASRRQGLGDAINYLNSLLDNRDIEGSYVDSLVDLLSGYFILSRRWKDAIDLIAWATESTSSFVVCQVLSLNELMAQWGHTGELPESLCRWWLEKIDNGGNSPYSAPELNQVNALAIWRLGDSTKALEELDRAIQWMNQHRQPRFSCWRYGTVSLPEFIEDCQQIRRMIQGEPIRPAFLGEPGTM